jgi:hypothetical protein
MRRGGTAEVAEARRIWRQRLLSNNSDMTLIADGCPLFYIGANPSFPSPMSGM